MTPAEKGFLLLSCTLGDPERKVLTAPQLRTLAERVRGRAMPEGDRELEAGDLTALGYGPELAERILALLAEEERLEHYLHRGRRLGCTPISRVSERYPLRLRQSLGLDSPGCLWAKGDLSLLSTPAVALVGSRELAEPNRAFAAEVGRQAAIQGFTLVSGNARGADKTAQEAALAAGGKVISIVADALVEHRERENVLYLSEDGFDEAFSARRALSRNRCIHALGETTFVAQSGALHGGTWDGTVKNLRFHWSGVYGFRDGSEAMALLEEMGAALIGIEALTDFGALYENTRTLFDQ